MRHYPSPLCNSDVLFVLNIQINRWYLLLNMTPTSISPHKEKYNQPCFSFFIMCNFWQLVLKQWRWWIYWFHSILYIYNLFANDLKKIVGGTVCLEYSQFSFGITYIRLLQYTHFSTLFFGDNVQFFNHSFSVRFH